MDYIQAKIDNDNIQKYIRCNNFKEIQDHCSMFLNYMKDFMPLFDAFGIQLVIKNDMPERYHFRYVYKNNTNHNINGTNCIQDVLINDENIRLMDNYDTLKFKREIVYSDILMLYIVLSYCYPYDFILKKFHLYYANDYAELGQGEADVIFYYDKKSQEYLYVLDYETMHTMSMEGFILN